MKLPKKLLDMLKAMTYIILTAYIQNEAPQENTFTFGLEKVAQDLEYTMKTEYYKNYIIKELFKDIEGV